MAFSNAVYGVISQVVDELYDGQDKKREKANTWVVGIGTIIAALLAVIAYLIDANVEWLPEWVVGAAPLLAMLGTLFGVSQTKNGVTRSLRDQINGQVQDMIDRQQRDAGHPGVPEPAAPTTSADAPATGSTPAGNVEGIADNLDNLAKRLANKE